MRFQPISCSLTALAALVLAVAALPAAAAETLSLCTARPDGNYYAAGEAIRKQAHPDTLRIALLETEGSVENLALLARDECDAAIVQLDAYLVYQDAHRGDRLALARPSYLYEEFVHLVCQRDSGVDSIEDLAGNPDHDILIGEPDSGSAATWRHFTLLDPSYAPVEAGAVGGMNAITEMRESDGPVCMMYVSGLRSEYSARVAELGKTVKLVPINDPDLDEARFAGERIYRFREIPADTYPSLQGNGTPRDVESLTVGATLFVTERWAAAHPEAHRHLIDAIERAKPAIAEKVAPH